MEIRRDALLKRLIDLRHNGMIKVILYNKKGVEETVFSFTPFLFAKVKYVGRIHVPFRSIYYLL